MTELLTKVFYGVWIPGQGWLKNQGKAYADERPEVAAQVAACIGMRAEVRYIDQSIIDFEPLYIAAEEAQQSSREKKGDKWHIFKNLMR